LETPVGRSIKKAIYATKEGRKEERKEGRKDKY
jgi:hypothetical protein